MTREPTSLGALMKISGQTNRTRFRKAVLRPLLDSGILAMTIPDKPSSSKQKYIITVKGMSLLENK
jgi:ATP-dependent DNA helicase RecG